jgi:hypothetical protein
VSFRLWIVGALTLCACRDHERSTARRSPVETAIARDLTAKLQVPVSATCKTTTCEAVLFDGTKLPITLDSKGNEWEWHVVGKVVDTTPIASHVRALLDDLKISRRVSCGARIQLVQPGSRISCMIEGGGMAFVLVDERGEASIELALDAASAAARMEPVTPQRDQALTKMSLDLERLAGESDGEDEINGAAATDGGVPNP